MTRWGPRAEARARVAGRYDVRVLEPSPPASTEPPFFADDPVLDATADTGLPVVSPVVGADARWEDIAADHPELAAFCRERWLGPYPALQPLPSSFTETRRALHRIAEDVIAPARKRANTKIGLRYTRAGFGTPFFGDDVQVRVERADLVVVERGEERRGRITTLPDAVALLGRDLAGDTAVDATISLRYTAEAAGVLGDWFGFAASVLEELRAEAGAAAESSRVQLWPEHFDLALELGSEAAGTRANYGLSPGDEEHPEPYVYVGPWSPPPAGELWNATGFPGAELSYSELLKADDARETALGFMRERLDALTG